MMSTVAYLMSFFKSIISLCYEISLTNWIRLLNDMPLNDMPLNDMPLNDMPLLFLFQFQIIWTV